MIEHNLTIEQMPINSLLQHPDNANNGDLDALEQSIKVNGFYQPVIVQKSTHHIIAGNHRYVIAIRMGMATIPAVIVDVTDEQAKRMMLADNRITRLGYDDEAALADLLEELYQTDTSLAGTGYDYNDLTHLLDLMDSPLNGEDLDPTGTEKDDDDDSKPKAHELRFNLMPVVSEDGKVYDLTVTKKNQAPISAHDFNMLRKAMGQEPLSESEMDTYDVPSWTKGRR